MNQDSSRDSGRYLNVRGRKMFYAETGTGVPVLYIHGNTGSHAWFREVMDVPGFRTIAPDMVNFGRSDYAEAPDIDLYADYIKGFMDELELKDCLVAGHSLGGAVAMSLSFRYPEMVSRLLLLDSCPVDGLVTPEEYYPVIEMYRTDRSLLMKALASVLGGLDDGDLLNFLTDEAMLMNGDAFSGNARALARVDYVEAARSFSKPVLVVSGGKDPIITEEAARKTAKLLNARLRIVEHAGHSLILEDPSLFKEILVEFAGN